MQSNQQHTSAGLLPKTAQTGREQTIRPGLEHTSRDGASILALKGEWTVSTLDSAAQAVADFNKRLHPPVSSVDLGQISKLDTSGALLINRLRAHCGSIGNPLPVTAVNREQQSLLELAVPPDNAHPARSGHSGIFAPLLNILETAGRATANIGERSMGMLAFFGNFLTVLGKTLLRPWKIRWTSLVYHMGETGVQAIGIVALLSALIGMVLAYMSSGQLAMFSMQIFVVKLLEVGVLREMAVLITAILVAGRSGSSFTAQIGSMKANEEVAAMRSMGIDPMETLVLPRILALVLMLPVLTLVADIAGMFGGLCAVWFSLDITPRMFMDALQQDFSLSNFMAGMLKAPFFAVVIGCVGCFSGFQAGNSADSVGRMTTTAVVESIFLVITLDAFFALTFMSLGL